MIELLYATGLRVTELVSVRLSGSASRRAVPHLHRQGQQGAAGADWRGGVCVDRRPISGPPASACSRAAARPAVRQRARRAAQPRRLLENPEAARPQGEPAAHAQPACAAPFVRHASARARRRSARDSDDARPLPICRRRRFTHTCSKRGCGPSTIGFTRARDSVKLNCFAGLTYTMHCPT